jgi:hypothetical protein
MNLSPNELRIRARRKRLVEPDAPADRIRGISLPFGLRLSLYDICSPDTVNPQVFFPNVIAKNVRGFSFHLRVAKVRVIGFSLWRLFP